MRRCLFWLLIAPLAIVTYAPAFAGLTAALVLAALGVRAAAAARGGTIFRGTRLRFTEGASMLPAPPFPHVVPAVVSMLGAVPTRAEA